MAEAAGTLVQQPNVVDYHPDAPRPPFVWTAQLPTTWRFLETHPSRWKVAATRLVDNFLPGLRLRAADKRILNHHIEEAVAQAQKAQVLIALVLPGVVNEEVSMATLLIRWIDSSPAPASVVNIQRQLETKNPQVEHTGSEECYVFTSASHLAGPVTHRHTAYTHQAFLPIPNTTWTLMVSGTAPSEETSPLIADQVRRIISSVYTYPDIEGEHTAEKLSPQSTAEKDSDQAMFTITSTPTGVYQQ